MNKIQKLVDLLETKDRAEWLGKLNELEDLVFKEAFQKGFKTGWLAHQMGKYRPGGEPTDLETQTALSIFRDERSL